MNLAGESRGYGFSEPISSVSGLSKSYQFVDNHTAGMNYYRLKIVDHDGSYDFSKIISVFNYTENSIIGSFYPNPSS